MADDPDASVRLAAFERLADLTRVHGPSLPWSALAEGFTVGGETVRFVSAAEGIFKPARMSGVLSIKTVVPKPKGRIWYADQARRDEAVAAPDDTLPYSFKGRDPDDVRNRWLWDAMQRRLPLIYFYGVAPAVYQPLFPVYVVDWNPATLSCSVAATAYRTTSDLWSPPPVKERRYAMRQVKQRLHQSLFRERVIGAYGGRCAFTALPALKLVDAAHIMPDRDEDLGQPDVRNGICMSKIHHAAFDADLIGIDPDYRIHVAPSLPAMHDGPMLEQGLKALDGRKIRVPERPDLRPDRDRLAVRFEAFRRAA